MRRGSRIEVLGSHSHIVAGLSRFENGSGELYDLATGPTPRTRRRVDGEWDDPTWLEVEVDEGWFETQLRKADEEERREQAKQDRQDRRIEDTRRRLARLEAQQSAREDRARERRIRMATTVLRKATAAALKQDPVGFMYRPIDPTASSIESVLDTLEPDLRARQLKRQQVLLETDG